ncbi:MAG TPA: hypothetical protein VK213_00320 [Bacteroidales bacterium]|nr:hypothetical protein [Bacteroidales bacterium]
MKKTLLFIAAFLILSGSINAQQPLIKLVKLDFDSRKLSVSYDIDSDARDPYYVWIEIGKKNSGEKINAKSLTGDIGEGIQAGSGKLVEWVPAADSIIIDEDVEIEIKAEKYVKSFNRGGAIVMSALLPGLGQTRISGGKPWWVTGITAYGLFAGGFMINKSANDDYDQYLQLKEDEVAREKMYTQAQQKMNLAGAFIISGALIWTTNMIWVASVPNRYRPLKNLSMTSSTFDNKPLTMVSYRINF